MLNLSFLYFGIIIPLTYGLGSTVQGPILPVPNPQNYQGPTLPLPNPQNPQGPTLPLPNPQNSQGPVIDIPQRPSPQRLNSFANHRVTCDEDTCVFECSELRSCRNTIFVSTSSTRTLQVLCRNRDACNNMTVLSNAATTKIQCDDHSCIGVHLFCNPSNGLLCEMSCEHDGCVPLAPIGSLDINHESTANSMVCKGNILKCNLKVQHPGAFINGKFFCGVEKGRCLMECDDDGEDSCRGSSYKCATDRIKCQCLDKFHGNILYPVQFNTGDCPKITFLTKAPSKQPPTN